ncbi:MAG: sigma-70 family RNA polymerase sigma factor [Phycisphaerae bacterium]
MSSAGIDDGFSALRRSAFGSDSCRQRFVEGTRSLLNRLDGCGRDIEFDLFKLLRAIEWYLEQDGGATQRSGEFEHELVSLRARLIDALVQRNTGLVFSMIKRGHVAEVDRDDLISHGLWTLLQSVLRFDPWRGYRFSSYACTAIGNGFRLLVRKNRLNRSRLAQLRARQRRPIHSDQRETDADREIMMERLQKTLAENHAELSEVERYVLDRRLLGTDVRPATLEAIGDSLELSKERVRQIQLMGLAKLRGFVAKGGAMSAVI